MGTESSSGSSIRVMRDTQVVIDGGRIIAVEPSTGQAEFDLLTPGLINAHTHLELSALARDPTPPASFVDWITSLRNRQPASDVNFSARIRAATHLGIDQCAKFGVTCVGDISQQSHLTRPILAVPHDVAGPLRAVSFAEVLGRGGLIERFHETLARAREPVSASPFLIAGLSPHAPFTVDETGYEACVALADELGQRLCTHLAETREEVEFVMSHTGEFRHMWERMGLWQDNPVPGVSPVEFAKRVGLLSRGALLAHVNIASDHDLHLLAQGTSSVVFCPRTRSYFGHDQTLGPHRWRDMLARGINVCVGTDSIASAGDLDLVAELRLVKQQTDAPSLQLLELVTFRAARALGLSDLGRIENGMYADLSAFAIEGDDPLDWLLTHPTACQASWVAGQRR